MNEKLFAKAVSLLKKGGVIIFPTDTAFGIGCCLNNPEAIKRLFAIRKRPRHQPVPVLVDSLKMAKKYWLPISPKIEKLTKRFWPGALTVVYPCKNRLVYPLVRGNGKTLGLRIPRHSTPLRLIRSLGVPILGPSANFHGEATPYFFGDLEKELIKKVDLVIPGRCQVGLASTVVDCTNEPFQVLRQGKVRIKL